MGPKPGPQAGILRCVRHLLAQEARNKHFEWGGRRQALLAEQ